MSIAAKSFALRKDILNLVYRGKAGHIGGDFSVCDILNVLYHEVMDVTPENFGSNERDHFVLSKGHCVEALYAVLADCGFFPKSALEEYGTFGTHFIGHPNNAVNGIEMNSGSLGHGLSVCVGMALALRMDGTSHRAYTVMGDGELAEGSVWEAAMAAGHYKLENLTAVIDRNRLQISGGTEEVMAHDDLDARWSAFGWHVLHTDGNDVHALKMAFDQAKAAKGRPTVIIADTVKGYGVSFMENQAAWHHKVPTEQEYEQAMRELENREQEAMKDE